VGQLRAPAPLPPGKSPWYSLDRRLGGPYSWFGRAGEEKIIPAPTGNRAPVVLTVVSDYIDWLPRVLKKN